MRKWLLFLATGAFLILIPLFAQDDKQESFGIDVSHHNGKIKWEEVSDVEFVYVKATEGATYVDPMYQQNIKGARVLMIPLTMFPLCCAVKYPSHFSFKSRM